jgi:hypothetical protein
MDYLRKMRRGLGTEKDCVGEGLSKSFQRGNSDEYLPHCGTSDFSRSCVHLRSDMQCGKFTRFYSVPFFDTFSRQ